MTELSRRGYAAARGISERAVRKYIAEGTLAPAVLPNGLLDSAIADKLLASALTKPKAGAVPLLLTTARMRRQRAIARDLLDQVGSLRRDLVYPGPTERAFNDGSAVAGVSEIARRWPARIAPRVAGRPADEGQRLLKTAVNELLGEMYEFTGTFVEDVVPVVEPDLNALTPVQLAALTENARAEILELERLERQRLLVRMDDVGALIIEALAVAKSVLNAIPGRLAQLVAIAEVAEAERLLGDEIEGFVAAMRVDLSSLTQGELK